MIQLIIFDIDGVITDGSIIIDTNGNEQKKVNLKDIDAIFQLKCQGFKIVAITGESTSIVDYFKNRFSWDYFYSGCKNKKEAILEIEQKLGVSSNEICYIGDGKYDVESLEYVGLGICPKDAIDKAKKASKIILQSNGGQGCLWEAVSILDNYNNVHCLENYFYQRLEEHSSIFKKMASNQNLIETVMTVAEKIYSIIENEGQILLCGNGGSAADAQHIATEFISRFYKDRPAMNAEALTVNTSTLTAIGNDYSFERIFVRQVEAKAKQGDMLIGISTSGKSKNVIEALRYAKSRNITTVMLMGDFENLELDDICNYVVKIPSKITPRIQEGHVFIGHTIAEYVEHKKFDCK